MSTEAEGDAAQQRLNDDTPPAAAPVNREHWLTLAIDALRDTFANAGYRLPPTVRVSVGWPSTGGLATKKPTHGDTWDVESADDKVPQLFISPVLADSIDALAVLAHELGHVVVGKRHGHRAPFVRFCKRIGLEGKPTDTEPGDELRGTLEGIAERLGDYPHAAVHGEGRKVQGTRLIKVTCHECGYTIRTTRKWLEVGTPTCPCSAQMVEGDPDDDSDDDEERDELLIPTETMLGFRTDDERFDVRYAKEALPHTGLAGSKKERAVWHVTDHEANAVRACLVHNGREYVIEAEARHTILYTRADTLGFIAAVREGVHKYPAQEGRAEIDPGEDFLDDDEVEVPDNPDADDDITREYERAELRRLHPAWTGERLEAEVEKRMIDVYPEPEPDDEEVIA